jgi:hypothetical protein
MTFAVSLYDALTAISVPRDRAIAVIEAMTQSMNDELAKKSDIAELRHHCDAEFVKVRAEIAELRQHCDAEFVKIRAEISGLRLEMRAMENRLLIKLGGLMTTLAALVFAAQQLIS